MKQAHQSLMVLLASIIAGAFSITGCGGGGGDDLTLSGKYSRGGFLRAGIDSGWAALGEADYNTDGTGTLSYSHSAFGQLDGLSIAYGLDDIGTLLETISVPGAAGETSNGAITADKNVMIVIDDDEDDGLRGIEAGIRLTSESVNPVGDYIQVGYYDVADGNQPETSYFVTTFNGDGTGSEVYEDSSSTEILTGPFTYAVGEEGKLSVVYQLAGGVSFPVSGAATSDKSVLAFVSSDVDTGDIGIELGIRKSSGMSASSLDGRYHFFIISSGEGTLGDTAVIDFDGAGNAVITGLEGMVDSQVSYTVAENGAFEFTMASVSLRGAVREDGSMFTAVGGLHGFVALTIGIAEWE